MNHAGLDRAYQVIVSAFVAFVLIFQAIISLGPIVGIEIGTRYWPLLNYAMYSRSFREGDTVNIYFLLDGVRQDGSIVEITMDTVGMHLWHYRNLVEDLREGRQEAIDHVLQSVPPGSPLIELRVKTFPVAVTRQGPREQESKVVDVVSLANRREGL
jgi:hypothetical protein